MKKLMKLVFALSVGITMLLSSCNFDATNVKATGVDWSAAYSIDKDITSKVKTGTVLKIEIEPNSGASYINVGVTSGWWTYKKGSFTDENGTALNQGSWDGNNWALLKDTNGNFYTTLYYTVDSDMAGYTTTEGGMKLVGSNYKVKSVSISGEDPLEAIKSEIEEIKKQLENNK